MYLFWESIPTCGDLHINLYYTVKYARPAGFKKTFTAVTGGNGQFVFFYHKFLVIEFYMVFVRYQWIMCDRNRSSVTETEGLWQKQKVSLNWKSLTETESLWQNQKIRLTHSFVASFVAIIYAHHNNKNRLKN